MATYDLTTNPPSIIKTGDILNCPYSGTSKTITLPRGTYKLEVWGAQGGYRSSASYGGKGGYSIGEITLTSKTDVFLFAGGSGNTGKTNGGFNGGGSRTSYNGGGGGSDIRIGSSSLHARVIVAGGGGSDGAASKGGGYGGGVNGSNSVDSNFGSGGNGATATAGGANNGTFGVGGAGVYSSSGYGGAGGGGWYGGGGVKPDSSGDDDKGGGGGSGYVYTSATASQYPSGCLLDSSHYLSNASTKAGNVAFPNPTTGKNETGHTGNGYCRITAIEVKGVECYRKENGTWTLKEETLFTEIADKKLKVVLYKGEEA